MSNIAAAKCCPFCGKRPDYEPKDAELEGDGWARIMCTNEKCDSQPKLTIYGNGGKRMWNSAVNRWNKRHE